MGNIEITWVWNTPYVEDEETGEMRIAENYEIMEGGYYD